MKRPQLLMIDILLLADTPTDTINTTCKQHVLRSVGALYYHSPSQHHNEIYKLNF
jgi:hypothetical protein